ncbi:MAG: ATP-grasp domain-containing protein [Deltaproteobacteria bacterium]|nr:MAG: ATP-grasp domain-containing protein [Deltaproteobacteria bacterium]
MSRQPATPPRPPHRPREPVGSAARGDLRTSGRKLPRSERVFSPWRVNVPVPTVFITPNPWYGTGLEALFPGFVLVTLPDDPLLEGVERAGGRVFALARHTQRPPKEIVSTPQLLAHPHTRAFLETLPKESEVLLFKSTARSERLLREIGLRVSTPPPAVARRFENKVHFASMMAAHGLPHLPYAIVQSDDPRSGEAFIEHFGFPLVCQRGFGFGGRGTHLIADRSQWRRFLRDHPGSRVKLSPFVAGSTVTLNACVTGRGETFTSEPFLQITGHPALTTRMLGACGNDWEIPLDRATQEGIRQITRKVGRLLAQEGFRGFFGLDFLRDPDGNLCLIEINPRFTSSLPTHTTLQRLHGQVPLLVRHLAAFSGRPQPAEGGAAIGGGGLLILHNLEGVDVEVTGRIPSGIYDADLSLHRTGHTLDRGMGRDRFLVLAAPAGRRLTPDAECARIAMLASPTAGSGELTPMVERLVRSLYRRLALRPLPPRV